MVTWAPGHLVHFAEPDANRRFGFTAAPALYETHKLTRYPRTESRHIAEDLVPAPPGILEKLDHPIHGEVSKVQSVL